jgi:hypothetical protein
MIDILVINDYYTYFLDLLFYIIIKFIQLHSAYKPVGL